MKSIRPLSLAPVRLYQHPIYFLETFVDPERFRGTCYRAVNWVLLGRTTGRGPEKPPAAGAEPRAPKRSGCRALYEYRRSVFHARQIPHLTLAHLVRRPKFPTASRANQLPAVA